MPTSTFFRRLAAGALIAALATSGVVLAGAAANAAPPAGTLGTLTFTPTTGKDLTVPTAQTSAACPTTGDDSTNVLVVGPVGAATPTFPADNPFPIVTTTTAAFDTTAPFSITFNKNLKDAATARGTTLQAGEYDVTARCVDGFTGTVAGTFTGALFFTSPTAYQTNDPNGPPPPPTTTVVPPPPTTTVPPPTTTVVPPPPTTTVVPPPPTTRPPAPGHITVTIQTGSIVITIGGRTFTLAVPGLTVTGTIVLTGGGHGEELKLPGGHGRAGDPGKTVSVQVEDLSDAITQHLTDDLNRILPSAGPGRGPDGNEQAAAHDRQHRDKPVARVTVTDI